jgi:hypothetical protein
VAVAKPLTEKQKQELFDWIPACAGMTKKMGMTRGNWEWRAVGMVVGGQVGMTKKTGRTGRS